MTETDNWKAIIRRLNDQFRMTFVGGRIVLSRCILGLDIDLRREIIRAVQTYTEWEAGNDPGEHDCGTVQIQDHKVVWRIDCLDMQLQQRSSDPSDANVTRRVLTIMLASET